jgi:hypothetical protein
VAPEARVRLARFLFVLIVACDGDPGPGDAGEGDGGSDGGMDAGRVIVEPDGGRDGGFDAGPPFDAGSDFRDFLAQLDGTVWSDLASRIEDGEEVERAYEMQFAGGGSPLWGEIRNPYGPARQRVLRFIRPAVAGCESASVCTIDTTVSIPDSSWETPAELRGRRESWRVEIIEGSPRALAIENERTGVEEIFTEGAWPAPIDGLTAEVRVYEGGSGEPISDAFCTTGPNLDNTERATLWELARGTSETPVLAYDVVAGAQLRGWDDVANRFGVRDVEGFDTSTLGGSERTDQFYFTVRYSGVVEHPGGRFQMREADDLVEDGLWAFVDTDIGSDDICDLLLEVQNYFTFDNCNCTDTFCDDATNDEPQLNFTAGDVPIEILFVRCMMPFEDQQRVEMRLGTGGYGSVADHSTRPVIDTVLFPPVL